jgi:hypothetical protein
MLTGRSPIGSSFLAPYLVSQDSYSKRLAIAIFTTLKPENKSSDGVSRRGGSQLYFLPALTFAHLAF